MSRRVLATPALVSAACAARRVRTPPGETWLAELRGAAARDDVATLRAMLRGGGARSAAAPWLDTETVLALRYVGERPTESGVACLAKTPWDEIIVSVRQSPSGDRAAAM